METDVIDNTENIEKRKKKKSKAAEGIEYLLKWSFLAAFILLVLAQVLLTDPSIMAFFNREAVDGEPLGNETYLFEPCKLELKLKNVEYCRDLKVLVNGDEAGDFSNGNVLLDLKDGDVIELDASKLLISADVQISAVSSNLTELLGRSFTAAGGIVNVAVVDTRADNSRIVTKVQ